MDQKKDVPSKRQKRYLDEMEDSAKMNPKGKADAVDGYQGRDRSQRNIEGGGGAGRHRDGRDWDELEDKARHRERQRDEKRDEDRKLSGRERNGKLDDVRERRERDMDQKDDVPNKRQKRYMDEKEDLASKHTKRHWNENREEVSRNMEREREKEGDKASKHKERDKLKKGGHARKNIASEKGCKRNSKDNPEMVKRPKSEYFDVHDGLTHEESSESIEGYSDLEDSVAYEGRLVNKRLRIANYSREKTEIKAEEAPPVQWLICRLFLH